MQFEYASHVKKLRGGGGEILTIVLFPLMLLLPLQVYREERVKTNIKKLGSILFEFHRQLNSNNEQTSSQGCIYFKIKKTSPPPP